MFLKNQKEIPLGCRIYNTYQHKTNIPTGFHVVYSTSVEAYSCQEVQRIYVEKDKFPYFEFHI
jgi:hypothetical protein